MTNHFMIFTHVYDAEYISSLMSLIQVLYRLVYNTHGVIANTTRLHCPLNLTKCNNNCNMSIAGFTGADCSVLADSPPFVRELISEPMCQLRINRCNSARFIVENFDISSVVCKVVRI